MSENTNNQNNNPYQSQDSNPYKNQESSPEMISSQNNYSNGQPNSPYQKASPAPVPTGHTKFCKFCAAVVPFDAVVCTSCGRQIEELKSSSSERIIINNTSTNSNTNATVNTGGRYGREKNKWVAFLLCIFLGVLGVHKFYEGKIFMGLLYLFTFGFGTIGVWIDLIVLLCKPNPYYV